MGGYGSEVLVVEAFVVGSNVSVDDGDDEVGAKVGLFEEAGVAGGFEAEELRGASGVEVAESVGGRWAAPSLLHKVSLDEVEVEVEVEGEVCCVCLSRLKKGQEEMRILPCLHEFHKICVDRWFNHVCRKTCPITKTSGLATVARGPMIELSKLATNDRHRSDVSDDQTAHISSRNNVFDY
ncbi:hypothetical protein SO802_006157 [Lithocarpus litseifolius]|uniref:RING-type E3 ubiquitin transferase n=1 Tax=Lithocarpus litseifolius TaxID=425828 RepID=A0AAW2DNG0_9ROSI